MTNTQKRTKFLYMLGKLLTFAQISGIEVICFTFYRSPEQQMQEFVKGKSKLRVGPHQSWLAIDLAIIKNGVALFDSSEATANEYKRLGTFWTSLGPDLVWGGVWKDPYDPYHFELR